MKFTRIKFTNYRCFIDGEIDFTLPKGCPPGKNIVLFSAENGGGKTQLMFAFRFALYGMTDFDFRDIQGQSATAYALNQNVYESLARGERGTSAEAKVELSFDFENKSYTIIRSHVFHASARGVSSPTERVVLKVQGSHGDTKAYKELDQVRSMISRIIPEKTLYALLCDGERVRQLSAAGSETDSAIQAVIQRMTEHDLLDSANQGISKIRKQVFRQMGKNSKDSNAQTDVVFKDNLERQIGQLQAGIESANQRIAKARARMTEISVDLREIAVVREKEQERQHLKGNIERFEKDLAEAEQKFIVTLNDQSYWGLGDSLCQCVAELLKDISLNFPGLQSDIVATVMKGDTCICGRPIDDLVRKVLDELRLRLPPINIDAELSSVLHQYGQDDFRTNRRKEMLERISLMSKIKKDIQKTQEIIESISREIEASSNSRAVELEEENSRLRTEELEQTRLLGSRNEELRLAREQLLEVESRIKEKNTRDENGRVLEAKLNLLQGAEVGIRCIKDYRERGALSRINMFLGNAFARLRSKSDSGRQIYITMFEDMHRLVVYHEASVEKELQSKAADGLSDDAMLELREKTILRHENSNSMGQLKMTSLAFMKAILDYVKDVAGRDRNLEDASYPIVVDAPFGDIKRDNFDNAVQYLHEFADQVVLLLADEKVPKQIEPYVAKVYSVRRTSTQDCPYEYSEITLEQ